VVCGLSGGGDGGGVGGVVKILVWKEKHSFYFLLQSL
jgi:hypothetical protein